MNDLIERDTDFHVRLLVDHVPAMLAYCVPAPLSRIAAPNVVYRKLAGDTPRSELVALSRLGAEWGAVQQYLTMLGERAAQG